jgi:menaquinone-dependent protoporphyrinogen oxidase
MRVLVAAASKHGATAELAERIGADLRAADARGGEPAEVDVRDAADVRTVAGYDAAVIGSAVYMGRWLDAARRLVEREGDALSAMPVWVFSSGPLGDPPAPEPSPDTTAAVVARISPRGQRVFAGRLEPAQLSFVERAMTRAVKAPAGDYRDWDAVRAWAEEIATALAAEGAPGR